ncbi:hypothetical protein [Bacillus pseudomycoides]|uniref:hypothetical protein n=1 Tax=Bacillus pseudomycoides TaxID=64104 RepID=UPI001FB27E49|nr:hypothetical protein [Bacillus pseudomycoides]
MSLDDKFNLERRIFIKLIEKHKQQQDIFSTAVILAYEHGLQVLDEIYELSKQEKEEEYPFKINKLITIYIKITASKYLLTMNRMNIFLMFKSVG